MSTWAQKITHYTTKEGGIWWTWPYDGRFGPDVKDLRNIGLGRRSVNLWIPSVAETINLHAFKLDTGSIWDCINGWRAGPGMVNPTTQGAVKTASDRAKEGIESEANKMVITALEKTITDLEDIIQSQLKVIAEDYANRVMWHDYVFIQEDNDKLRRMLRAQIY